MKKIVVWLMSLLMVFSAVPVYAQESTDSTDDVKVVDAAYSYTPTDDDGNATGETVYTLSAIKRDYDQKIEIPVREHYIVLESQTTDLSDITAEMDPDSDGGLAKKDISVTVTQKAQKQARLEVTFANDKVTTTLNDKAGILIKKDGKTIKRLPFSYSTPALTDEHDAPKFHTLSAWSGKTQYDQDGDQFKLSGTVDVYKKDSRISYTYQSLGTYGVKNFLLNSSDYFTFTNGKTTIAAKNGNPGQKNTVTLKCTSAYLKALKKMMAEEFCKNKTATGIFVFDDIAVEYKTVAGNKYENGIGDNGQGCVIGGSMDPIYLGHYATVKPVGKAKIKSYKKGKTSIKLKWNKLSTPVSGYMIYRSTKKSSGYKKVKTVSSKTTSYTDKGLKKGKTYYYKLRPYRTVTYTYKTSKNKTKKLSRKAYGSYTDVKKIKTKK